MKTKIFIVLLASAGFSHAALYSYALGVTHIDSSLPNTNFATTSPAVAAQATTDFSKVILITIAFDTLPSYQIGTINSFNMSLNYLNGSGAGTGVFQPARPHDYATVTYANYGSHSSLASFDMLGYIRSEYEAGKDKAQVAIYGFFDTVTVYSTAQSIENGLTNMPSITMNVSVIPEPASVVLAGFGLTFVALRRKRQDTIRNN